MRFLQREFGRRLVETVSGASEYHLLTDGTKIYLENSAHEIIDILKSARQPIFSVCLTGRSQARPGRCAADEEGKWLDPVADREFEKEVRVEHGCWFGRLQEIVTRRCPWSRKLNVLTEMDPGADGAGNGVRTGKRRRRGQ